MGGSFCGGRVLSGHVCLFCLTSTLFRLGLGNSGLLSLLYILSSYLRAPGSGRFRTAAAQGTGEIAVPLAPDTIVFDVHPAEIGPPPTSHAPRLRGMARRASGPPGVRCAVSTLSL